MSFQKSRGMFCVQYDLGAKAVGAASKAARDLLCPCRVFQEGNCMLWGAGIPGTGHQARLHAYVQAHVGRPTHNFVCTHSQDHVLGFRTEGEVRAADPRHRTSLLGIVENDPSPSAPHLSLEVQHLIGCLAPVEHDLNLFFAAYQAADHLCTFRPWDVGG